MPPALLGMHHVTAIVDEPQENLDFYTQVLGLHLVKQTVNFDDPSTYHLYYGDATGQPGTLVTFFPWPGGRRGSRGSGQISAFAFRVPQGSLRFWQAQLDTYGWRYGHPVPRDGAEVLAFYDPAGLLVELVAAPAPAAPADPAISGLHGVTLTLADTRAAADFFDEQLGFRRLGAGRWGIGEGVATAELRLIARPDLPRGQVAVGGIHHVAWRVGSTSALEEWRAALDARQTAGLTLVRDRRYFRSIYFRTPGDILFELASDPPGFAVDELPDQLGRTLMLPDWLEPRRARIAERLPPLSLRTAPE